MDKFRFSRFTHNPWLRVLKVFVGFACRILAVGWQGTQDILTIQFSILPPIFSMIHATTRVTRPLLARRSVLLIQFVGAWDWVLGLAGFWSPHRHGVREQGCHHHPRPVWEPMPRRGSLIRTARDCTKSELQCTVPNFTIARARVKYKAMATAREPQMSRFSL